MWPRLTRTHTCSEGERSRCTRYRRLGPAQSPVSLSLRPLPGSLFFFFFFSFFSFFFFAVFTPLVPFSSLSLSRLSLGTPICEHIITASTEARASTAGFRGGYARDREGGREGWSHGETWRLRKRASVTRKGVWVNLQVSSHRYISLLPSRSSLCLVRSFSSLSSSLSFFLFLSHPCARCPRRTTFSSDTRFHLCCLWYLARCCHAHPPCPPCSLPRVVRSSRIRPPAVRSLSLSLSHARNSFSILRDDIFSFHRIVQLVLLRSSSFTDRIQQLRIKTLLLIWPVQKLRNREIWIGEKLVCNEVALFYMNFWMSFFLLLRFLTLSFHFSDYAQFRPAFLQTRFRLISISIIPAGYYPWVG